MRRDIIRVAVVCVLLLAGFGVLLEVVTRYGDGQGNVEGTGKFYRLTHAQVDGTLGSDGALTVSERITFEFHGNFSGAYRDIPLADDQTFENIGVREGAHRLRLRRQHRARRLRPARHLRRGRRARRAAASAYLRIVWHYSATDEARMFHIHYRFPGLTKAYADAVDVFWQVWGDDWKGSLDTLDADADASRPTCPGQRAHLGASRQHPGHRRAPGPADPARRRRACRASSSSSCARCCRAPRWLPTRRRRSHRRRAWPSTTSSAEEQADSDAQRGRRPQARSGRSTTRRWPACGILAGLAGCDACCSASA